MKSAVLILCITATIFPQAISNNFSASDKYSISSIIKVEDSAIPVSERILYPGFRPDSSSSIAAGIIGEYYQGLHTSYDVSNVYNHNDNSLGFDNIYLWGSYNWRNSQTGVWISDLNLSESDNIWDYKKTDSASGRIAIWHHLSNYILKGISIQAGCREYKTEYSSLIDYPSSGSESKKRQLNYFFTVNSLWAVNSYADFIAGCNYYSGKHNDHYKDAVNIIDDYYSVTYAYNGGSAINYRYNLYDKDSTLKSGTIYTGLINKKGQTIKIGLIANTENISVSTNEPGFRAENNGTSGFFLSLSDSRRFTLDRHSLDIGAIIYLDALYYSTFSHYAYFSDLPNFNKQYYRKSGSILFPVNAELCLFNSSFYAVFGFTPIIWGSVSAYYGQKSHNRKLDVDHAEIGLKGKAGKHVEFTLIPYLDRKILVTSAELKYRF